MQESYQPRGSTFKKWQLRKALVAKTSIQAKRKTLSGPTLDQKELAKSYSKHASIHYKMHNYLEAQKSEQRALEITVRLFGNEHESTAESYLSLGITQRKLGDFSSALQSKQRAMDIRRKLFGEEHAKTADSYYSLGITQGILGDFSSALDSLNIVHWISGVNCLEKNTQAQLTVTIHSG